MAKHLTKPITRLLMFMLIALIAAPLSRASVTLDIKANSAPYVYAYYDVYDENEVPTKIEPLGAWPGTLMTNDNIVTNIYGESRYRVFFPLLVESKYATHPDIILNDGNGNQTGTFNLYNANEESTRYYDVEYDGVSTYQFIQRFSGSGYGDNDTQWMKGLSVNDNDQKVWYAPLSNYSGNTYNYVYAWNSTTGVKYAGDWPGSPMTEEQFEEYGSTRYYYSYDFSEACNLLGGAPDRIIFVRYDGQNVNSQTGDIVYHPNLVFLNVK